MEQLTLAKAWRLCLEQWETMDLDVKDIYQEKHRTLQKLGYTDVDTNCFFCEYSRQKTGRERVELKIVRLSQCEHCPGKLIHKTFYCLHPDYSYNLKPHEFLVKLQKLNKRRLCQNRQKHSILRKKRERRKQPNHLGIG